MKISDKIQRVMASEKISSQELAYMVDHAAKITRGPFNRRYYQWLFKIRGESLEDMQYFNRIVIGVGRDKVSEEHEPCLGQGCKGCGWSGEIVRRISDKPIPRHEPLPLYFGN